MKNKSYFAIIALALFFTLSILNGLKAQEKSDTKSVLDLGCRQWNTMCNTTDPIWRSGNVGIGTQATTGVGLTIDASNGTTGLFSSAPGSAIVAYSFNGTQPTIVAQNQGGGVSALLDGKVRILNGGLDFSYSSASINFQDELWIKPGNFKFNPDGLFELSSIKVAGLTQTFNLKVANLSETNFLKVTTLAEAHTLHVSSKIYSKEVIVKLPPFPDYVFGKGYDLLPLESLESFIKENKRLPGMPSAEEVEKNGGNIGELLVKQTEKIEELTLYILELNKRIEQLEKENVKPNNSDEKK